MCDIAVQVSNNNALMDGLERGVRETQSFLRLLTIGDIRQEGKHTFVTADIYHLDGEKVGVDFARLFIKLKLFVYNTALLIQQAHHPFTVSRIDPNIKNLRGMSDCLFPGEPGRADEAVINIKSYAVS